MAKQVVFLELNSETQIKHYCIALQLCQKQQTRHSKTKLKNKDSEPAAWDNCLNSLILSLHPPQLTYSSNTLRGLSKSAHFNSLQSLPTPHLPDLETEGLLQSLVSAQCPRMGESLCPCPREGRQLQAGPHGLAVVHPAKTGRKSRYHFGLLTQIRNTV